MEVTINQIIDLFKFCADGHYAIVSYGYGDRWELPFKGKGEARRNYPILWVTPLTHRIQGVQIHRRFRLIVGDVVRRGEGNEQEVESDTERWLTDIIAVIRNTHPLPISVELVTDNIEITPFTESSGDNLTGHYADITLKSDYKFNKCEAAGSWLVPPPPPLVCQPANYIVKNESGDILAQGTISSGSSKTITVPDGGDAIWELVDTDGNILATGFIPAGGSATITAPDSTIENSDGSYLVTVTSGGNLTLPDVDILVVDINDNPLDSATIPSVKNHTIDVVCVAGTVENSDQSYITTVVSGGSLTLPDINVTDSDGTTTTFPSVKDVVCTFAADADVENSDQSYSTTVASGGALVLPDQTIEVNGVNEGNIPSVGTIEVELNDDDGNPFPPQAVNITGRKIEIDVNGMGFDTAAFVILVNTGISGETNENQFKLNLAGTYNVKTSDGQNLTNQSGVITLTFPYVGQILIQIFGDVQVNYGTATQGGIAATLDRNKLLQVVNWGTSTLTLAAAFQGLNTQITAKDAPTLGGTSIVNIFRARIPIGEAINTWDVSSIESMLAAFLGNSAFNMPLNNWNTGNVNNMNQMFRETLFNQNIGAWDVSKVTAFGSSATFEGMFYNATAFNNGGSADINNWNINTIQNVNMNQMFRSATAFNQPIGNWNTSSVTDMGSMFQSATAFNQNLGAWDVSKATFENMFNGATAFNNGGSADINNWTFRTTPYSMVNMFRSATAFNQDISSWNVGNCNNMTSMFRSATAFNQDISSWNVGNVTNMTSMFNTATSFNQNIGSWDVSKVTAFGSSATFEGMFYNATAFNQNLGAWQLRTAGTNLNQIFRSSGMNTANYTDTIVGWANYVFANSGTPANVNMTGQVGMTFTNSRSGGANFADAQAARAYLISVGWTITGDTIV
jgi:surface protein